MSALYRADIGDLSLIIEYSQYLIRHPLSFCLIARQNVLLRTLRTKIHKILQSVQQTSSL